VTQLGFTHEFAKAGVMMRETLNPNAKNAMMYVSGNQRWSFQRRINTEGETTSNFSDPGAFSLPYWVRMVRKGNVFEGYISSDGQKWTLISTETIAMGSDIFWGLAVTSHDDTQSTTASFDNITTTTGTITTLPNTPPIFTLSASQITDTEDFVGTKLILQGL